jgi:hypothetical protein
MFLLGGNESIRPLLSFDILNLDMALYWFLFLDLILFVRGVLLLQIIAMFIILSGDFPFSAPHILKVGLCFLTFFLIICALLVRCPVVGTHFCICAILSITTIDLYVLLDWIFFNLARKLGSWCEGFTKKIVVVIYLNCLRDY